MTGTQTLHSHTTASDGQMTHLELLDCSEKHDVSVVAFTDHDTLPNIETINILRSYRGRVNWICGIEISSGLPKELGGGVFPGLHITGLFVDPTNKKLLEYSAKALSARTERMERMVKNLQGIGFDITELDCLMASGGEAVGRPHIVQAIISKPENLKRIETLRIEMSLETDEKIKEKYQVMMQKGDTQYPFVLFLSEDSYIPNIYVDYLYWEDMDSVVKLIRGAGGLAFIAHYSTAKKKIPYEMMEQVMESKRIDGVEVVYAMQAFEYQDWKNDMEWLSQKADEYGILKSGGADIHKKEQIELFSQMTEFSGNTIGMAEKMIKHSGVSTTWSSF